MVSDRETDVRNAQEQSSKLQTELNRLRQELQDKTSQEETMRQQVTEKEEKTRKAFVMAKQKISQLIGEMLQPVEPLNIASVPMKADEKGLVCHR